MTLTTANTEKEYIIAQVSTQEPELDNFLFSLGCYSGQPITIISRRKQTLTVAIKDSRYSIDARLGQAITVVA